MNPGFLPTGSGSKMEPATGTQPQWETTHAEFSFWVRGVLSRCSGVVTMALWLHTGVDVRDGFSRCSRVSCLVHMLRNWNNTCQLADRWCTRAGATGLNDLPEMERRARFWRECSWESWSYWHQETRRCVSGFYGSVWRAAWPLQERWG